MKTLDKRLLDEIIRLTRKYTKTGDVDLLWTRHTKAGQLSTQTFGNDYRWLAITDMVSSILGPSGLIPHAANATIYRAFEAVGFEVRDVPQEVPDELG